MNFPFSEQLIALFGRYSDDYEYTSEGIFRLVTPPQCPECGTLMDHNGSNSYTKRWLGIVKIGKYLCPKCQKNVTEACDFWKDAKKEFFGIFGNFCQLLRVNHVSYEVIEKASSYFYPCDKDTIHTMVSDATEKMEIPEIKDIQIVHYDEQHPKAGRSQMYRLTLLDYRSKQVIADELFDSKDMKTVEDFLRRNLDANKPIFIVTDLSLGYKNLLKKVFNNMVTHQLCLLHLNKLIVNDFSVNATIAEELIKYRLLNIFYNRRMEIEFLSCLIEEEQEMKMRGGKVYEEWLDEARTLFKRFVHSR
ncbi:MAG: ISNCY family transposase [Methanothrix sp.]